MALHGGASERPPDQVPVLSDAAVEAAAGADELPAVPDLPGRPGPLPLHRNPPHRLREGEKEKESGQLMQNIPEESEIIMLLVLASTYVSETSTENQKNVKV